MIQHPAPTKVCIGCGTTFARRNWNDKPTNYYNWDQQVYCGRSCSSRHNRKPKPARTHCFHGHELTPENTVRYGEHRYAECRTCRDASTKRAKARHPERVASWQRARRLRHNYSLTVEAFDELLASQGGHCAVSGCERRAWCVDHDHATGAVRGILCIVHNRALGTIEAFGLELALYVSESLNHRRSCDPKAKP